MMIVDEVKISNSIFEKNLGKCVVPESTCQQNRIVAARKAAGMEAVGMAAAKRAAYDKVTLNNQQQLMFVTAT